MKYSNCQGNYLIFVDPNILVFFVHEIFIHSHNRLPGGRISSKVFRDKERKNEHLAAIKIKHTLSAVM